MTDHNDTQILRDAMSLHRMWKQGKLGGEVMPEDVHPNLAKDSKELLHYLTLGMCLNYQRNSYKLWEACTAAYFDDDVNWIFSPELVAATDENHLRPALIKHKVALQPNKHTNNWSRVSGGIVKYGQGDMRLILEKGDYDIAKIRNFIQTNRKNFPYLAGEKICNYWLFVLLQYTSFPIRNRRALTIAPDTHVLNASARLGLLSIDDLGKANAQTVCSNAWERLLSDSGYLPIDFHTPLWLWSRLGYPQIIPAP